jgi:ribosomal protein S18 acetylase RimI-like enzyme
MRVREAASGDLEGIRAVAEASWERDYADLLTRDTVAAGVNDWYDEASLADQIGSERTPVLVAEADGGSEGDEKEAEEEGEETAPDDDDGDDGDSDDASRGVVGFAHGYVDGEEGHVLRLYVHPAQRRAGAGEALLSATVAALRERGAGEVAATVLAANERGRAFYESQGFEAVGDAAETTIGGETYPEARYVLEGPGSGRS